MSIKMKTAFEIELDMRISAEPQGTIELGLREYAEAIASQYPLLGMAVLDEERRNEIEDSALMVIKKSLFKKKIDGWESLVLFLAIIQYAKDWERGEGQSFWNYMSEQFGRATNDNITKTLQNSVKKACRCYNRFFDIGLIMNKRDNYYPTVLAHSLSPKKSFYALCDFLEKFYKNNLRHCVYEEDPAISRMVEVLGERCQGALKKDDDDISGNVNDIQIGIRTLVRNRPGYIKHFFTKLLQRVDALHSGKELPGRDYVDVLMTHWFLEKLTRPDAKEDRPIHRRTTEIAFSHEKIRIEYVLDEEGEPAIRVPSIRLARPDNPTLTLFSNDEIIYQYEIGIYGNDYSATSEEVIVPLSEMQGADFTGLAAAITIDDEEIFDSGAGLHAKALLFKEGNLQTGTMLDEGDYVLFAPKTVSIGFHGDVANSRRSYFAQLYDIYIQGEASIFADGALLFTMRTPEGSFRLELPRTQAEYVLGGTSYALFGRDEFNLSAIGLFEGKNVVATTRRGEELAAQSEGSNSRCFIPPIENGRHIVSLADKETGRIYDEIAFFIIDRYSVSFDKDYYLESTEGGSVTIEIEGRHFEKSLTGLSSKVTIPWGNGEIRVQIPRVRLLLDDEPLPNKAIWKGDVSPSSILSLYCPETVSASLDFGGVSMVRRTVTNGLGYAIGNAVQAYDGPADRVPVTLRVEGDAIVLFDVVFKTSLTEPPEFILTQNTLSWSNSNSFMGDKDAWLKFIFRPKQGKNIVLAAQRGKRVLSDEFPSKSERYDYEVIALSESAFGVSETKLRKGAVILGERAAVIFRGETLQITQVIENGEFIKIKPVYLEDVIYIETETLDYTDLSGDYARYTANLFYMTREGKRYFRDLNPVEVYLVNERSRTLHITFREGDGLFTDKRGYYGVELYKHADPPREQRKFFAIPDFFVY